MDCHGNHAAQICMVCKYIVLIMVHAVSMPEGFQRFLTTSTKDELRLLCNQMFHKGLGADVVYVNETTIIWDLISKNILLDLPANPKSFD